MKIIFLDFDGVLNPPNDIIVAYRDINKIKFGKEAVDNLNYILKQTGALVVVSSTWRGNMERLRFLFKNNCIYNRIIGQTPWHLKDAIRGDEIKYWLKQYSAFGITNFVIIDDSDDMGDLKPYLVQTNGLDALTKKDAEKAIKILNEGWERFDEGEIK